MEVLKSSQENYKLNLQVKLLKTDAKHSNKPNKHVNYLYTALHIEIHFIKILNQVQKEV